MLEEDRRVDEGARGARVDQSQDGDGWLAWKKEMNTMGEMAGSGVRGGVGKWEDCGKFSNIVVH